MNWKDLIVEYGNKVLEGTEFSIENEQKTNRALLDGSNTFWIDIIRTRKNISSPCRPVIFDGETLFLHGNKLDVKHPDFLTKYKSALINMLEKDYGYNVRR